MLVFKSLFTFIKVRCSIAAKKSFIAQALVSLELLVFYHTLLFGGLQQNEKNIQQNIKK